MKVTSGGMKGAMESYRYIVHKGRNMMTSIMHRRMKVTNFEVAKYVQDIDNMLEHGFDLKHDQQCRLSTSHFIPCVSSLLCSKVWMPFLQPRPSLFCILVVELVRLKTPVCATIFWTTRD